MTVPKTKTARQQRIIDAPAAHEVRSQAELARLLADDDVDVTQATLSRDLDELGAVRVRTSDGHLVYAVPPEGGDARLRGSGTEDTPRMERLARRLGELLVSADYFSQPGRPAHATRRGALPCLRDGPQPADHGHRDHRRRRHRDARHREPDGGVSVAAELLAAAERARTATASDHSSHATVQHRVLAPRITRRSS